MQVTRVCRLHNGSIPTYHSVRHVYQAYLPHIDRSAKLKAFFIDYAHDFPFQLSPFLKMSKRIVKQAAFPVNFVDIVNTVTFFQIAVLLKFWLINALVITLGRSEFDFRDFLTPFFYSAAIA